MRTGATDLMSRDWALCRATTAAGSDCTPGVCWIKTEWAKAEETSHCGPSCAEEESRARVEGRCKWASHSWTPWQCLRPLLHCIIGGKHRAAPMHLGVHIAATLKIIKGSACRWRRYLIQQTGLILTHCRIKLSTIALKRRILIIWFSTLYTIIY